MSRPISKMFLAFGAFIIASTISQCAYPNQFRDVPHSQPHAVLTAKPSPGFFADQLLIMHINGQPTSFWRSDESFRVPPGSTRIHPIFSSSDPFSYRPIRFTAIAGHQYLLRRLVTPRGEFAALSERISGGAERPITESPKDNSP